MLNDIETKFDYLNFSGLADYIASLIRNGGDEPISIGVSGRWGAGKSSLVTMAGERLLKGEGCENLILVKFDAWLYQGYDDARGALLQNVADVVEEEVEKRKGNLEKCQDFLRRINWLRVASRAAPIILGSIMGGASGAAVSLFPLLSGIVESGTAPSQESIQKLVDWFAQLPEDIKQVLKERDAQSIPREISKLRISFANILSDINCRLVVIIDDLDRCLPETALSTLEAMRLLLFTRKTAFIIAADERMIRNSVKIRYQREDVDDSLVTSYFDKLIQMPITVPRPGLNEVKCYLLLLLARNAISCCTMSGEKLSQPEFDQGYTSLFGKLKQSWTGRITREALIEAMGVAAEKLRVEIEMVEQISAIMTTSKEIGGNPRLIKRFVNNLLMRHQLAQSQGMNLDFDSIVKMQVLERCAPRAAFEHLVKCVAESPDGKVEFLSIAEKKFDEGEDLDALPQEWNNPFLKEWITMSPRFGGMDLRPLLYLSREDSVPIFIVDDLSPIGREMVSMLLARENYSNEVLQELKKLDEAESVVVFAKLVRAARREEFNPVSLVRLCYIPIIFERVRPEFLSLLTGLPPCKRPLAIIPQLNKESWVLPLLKRWKEDAETPKTVRNAIKA